MERKYNIGILGATGLVGQTIMSILEEREIPCSLSCYASNESLGKRLLFNGEELYVQQPSREAFCKNDIVFGAISSDISRKYSKSIIDSGALYIDNSSAFRMEQSVPLVIPEINPECIFKNNGIIANPNCSTIICLTAIYPILKEIDIDKIVIDSYQAVSGAGYHGIQTLYNEEKGIDSGNAVFPKPIYRNVIPCIGEIIDDISQEEVKIKRETAKIIGKELDIFNTCVRVPVERCHSFSITIVCKEAVSLESIIELYKVFEKLSHYKGFNDKCIGNKPLKLLRNNYPTPLECSDRDTVYIGRLRVDKKNQNVISLWCCGDQLRKGAATNAVQIAEIWLKHKKPHNSSV